MSQLGTSLLEVQWLERPTGVLKGMASTPVAKTEISVIFNFLFFIIFMFKQAWSAFSHNSIGRS